MQSWIALFVRASEPLQETEKALQSVRSHLTAFSSPLTKALSVLFSATTDSPHRNQVALAARSAVPQFLHLHRTSSPPTSSCCSGLLLSLSIIIIFFFFFVPRSLYLLLLDDTAELFTSSWTSWFSHTRPSSATPARRRPRPRCVPPCGLESIYAVIFHALQADELASSLEKLLALGKDKSNQKFEKFFAEVTLTLCSSIVWIKI